MASSRMLHSIEELITYVGSIQSNIDAVSARNILVYVRRLISESPHKIGYQLSPGGILNAYREGDIDMDEAIYKLRDAFLNELDEAKKAQSEAEV